jgi:hypothetical protein
MAAVVMFLKDRMMESDRGATDVTKNATDMQSTFSTSRSPPSSVCFDYPCVQCRYTNVNSSVVDLASVTVFERHE